MARTVAHDKDDGLPPAYTMQCDHRRGQHLKDLGISFMLDTEWPRWWPCSGTIRTPTLTSHRSSPPASSSNSRPYVVASSSSIARRVAVETGTQTETKDQIISSGSNNRFA